MYALDGVSFGLQLGAQATDLVLLVMNRRGLEALLSSKVKLGGSASAAAGPKGRDVSAATDVTMRAEILSYSRTRGLFAGVSLDGASLRPDNDASEQVYGRPITARTIVNATDLSVPAAGRRFVDALEKERAAKRLEGGDPLRTLLFARLILAAAGVALVAACGTWAADGEAAPAAISRGAADASRDVTIPSGTVLRLTLNTAVASDTSEVEDAVAAELTNAVMVGSRTALPSGALVAGVVRAVDPSGRVKGRAHLALDFTSVTSGGRRYVMSAGPFSRRASATKGEDATKIGIGAGAGAVIGGLFGGKKGAAQGAAVGGGAGTGLVLATRGEEVRFPSGTDVSIQLAAPLTVRVSK